MYRAPIDSGKGRVGAMIANALQGGAQSIAGGLQERHRREQEAEALSREKEREAEAQRRYREAMDLQYGPQIERALAYETNPKDMGFLQVPGQPARAMPTPQITVPGRSVPMRGGSDEISAAMSPQTRQATTTTLRPGVFAAGNGGYRDYTQSHGHRVGEIQAQQAAQAQAAAAEQEIAALVAANIPEQVARAMVANQAFGKHHFDTEIEGVRQKGREALEAKRHQNRASLVGASGGPGAVSPSLNRLLENDERTRVQREAEGNAATWARNGQSAEHISLWLRSQHRLSPGEANRIATRAVGGGERLAPAQALSLVPDYDEKENPIPAAERIRRARELQRAWAQGAIEEEEEVEEVEAVEPRLGLWSRIFGGSEDGAAAAVPVSSQDTSQLDIASLGQATMIYAQLPASQRRTAMEEDGYSPEEIAYMLRERQ